jgi:hypothetical protein
LRRLLEYVEKYGRDQQATNDNITRRMGTECLVNKATDTQPEYAIFIAFPGNNSYTNAPQLYVISTLPLFFPISLITAPTILAVEDLATVLRKQR